jgi:hypothetical protein
VGLERIAKSQARHQTPPSKYPINHSPYFLLGLLTNSAAILFQGLQLFFIVDLSDPAQLADLLIYLYQLTHQL